MTPMTINPTVRIWRDCEGNILRVESNVAPELKVEVVDIHAGKTIEDVDPLIEGSYPFVNAVVEPTPRC